jgi:hypothetical protein
MLRFTVRRMARQEPRQKLWIPLMRFTLLRRQLTRRLSFTPGIMTREDSKSHWFHSMHGAGPIRSATSTRCKLFPPNTNKRCFRLMKARRKTVPKKKLSEPDDFVSVARRLGADESKERFEAKLKKIATVKPKREEK